MFLKVFSAVLAALGVLLQTPPLFASDQVVSIGAARYRVLLSADAAAAVSLKPEPSSSTSARAFAGAAIEQASGCLIRSGTLHNFGGVYRAELQCPPPRARSARSTATTGSRGGWGLIGVPEGESD